MTSLLFNEFLWALLIQCFFCCLILNNDVVEASHKIYTTLRSVDPPTGVLVAHKPLFHFRPQKNWINDPNGPMYYKGIYHFFYQYNPSGAVWGNIVWAHSVSKDLINWRALETAIAPSKPFDHFGCWSGSATILPDNKPVILYTGIVDSKNTQVQNYAVPADYSDPFLRKWIKPGNNPLIVADTGVNGTAFRDPTTAWLVNGLWKLVVGSRSGNMGVAYLYRSKDFMKWTKAQQPLHSMAGTGMWECPDFYPVSLKGSEGVDNSVTGSTVKHVFKVSLDVTRYEFYTLGTYDTEKDIYIPEKTSVDGWKGLRYDYGNFYASKTFFDNAKKRRILWGWANESDSVGNDIAKGWAGIQAIPRKVWLDPNGKQLVQWPIEESKSLRGKKVGLGNLKLNKGEHIEVKGITAAQADVEVTFAFQSLDKAEPYDPKWDNIDAQDVCAQRGSGVVGGLGPFGLLTLASSNLEEFTPVFFRVFKATNNKYKVLMCSDATRSSLEAGTYKPSFAGYVDTDLHANKKTISLRCLIDHSVVESFGAGGKTCITSRVYPTLSIHERAHLHAFNNGSETITISSFNAWSINKPQMK